MDCQEQREAGRAVGEVCFARGEYSVQNGCRRPMSRTTALSRADRRKTGPSHAELQQNFFTHPQAVTTSRYDCQATGRAPPENRRYSPRNQPARTIFDVSFTFPRKRPNIPKGSSIEPAAS
jgi:hypothetical protein